MLIDDGFPLWNWYLSERILRICPFLLDTCCHQGAFLVSQIVKSRGILDGLACTYYKQGGGLWPSPDVGPSSDFSCRCNNPSSRIFSRDRNHAVGQPENLHAPRLQLTHRSGSTISCHLCGNRGRKKRNRPFLRALKTPRYKVPRNRSRNKTLQFPH